MIRALRIAGNEAPSQSDRRCPVDHEPVCRTRTAVQACEKIAVVQAVRPAVSGGPDRLRQGYGGPPKHLRRRKLYAVAEGPFYLRSVVFTGSVAGVVTNH